jgi:hypothetical protein
MNYAKVENGQVIQVGLPTTGTLKDGSTVSGYNFLPESVLLEEGWLPLKDNPPVYNADTEYLERTGYTVGATEVIANYSIKQKEPVIAIPTTEERLAAVEEALLMII